MRVDDEQRLCQSAPSPSCCQANNKKGGGARALTPLLPTSLVCTTSRLDFQRLKQGLKR